MNYKSPLKYFNSAAASSEGSLILDLIDASDQAISLLLDRAIDSHNHNEIFLNHTRVLSLDELDFWHIELSRVYQETHFEYEGEKQLVAEFITTIEKRTPDKFR